MNPSPIVLLALLGLTSCVQAPDCPSSAPDGTCAQPSPLLPDVGVPVGGCGIGFAHEGYACEPILPADPCPKGWMAIPGETECHEVAPCGTGDYGNIPIDQTTQFVNAAYQGVSTGSRDQPWKTIQEGIDAAEKGAVVAIAAGIYTENLDPSVKPVHIWGRCPSLVTLVIGSTTNSQVPIPVGVRLHDIPGDGWELHQMAIEGQGIGVSNESSASLVLDKMWIHDLTHTGILATRVLDSPSVVVRSSLIEATKDAGIQAISASVVVDQSVLRDTQPGQVYAGPGILAQASQDLLDFQSIVVTRRSLIERNTGAGVVVIAGVLTVEDSVVRDTAPRSDGTWGGGIDVQGAPYPITNTSASATIRGSVVERNHSHGILVLGADATIETTVVRDIRQTPQWLYGRGINIEVSHGVTMVDSVVEHTVGAGIFTAFSPLTVTGSLVRDIGPNDGGEFGDGISILATDPEEPTQIERSWIAQSSRAAVTNYGGVVKLGSTKILCNTMDLVGSDYEGSGFLFEHAETGSQCGCPDAQQACQVVTKPLSQPPSLAFETY